MLPKWEEKRDRWLIKDVTESEAPKGRQILNPWAKRKITEGLYYVTETLPVKKKISPARILGSYQFNLHLLGIHHPPFISPGNGPIKDPGHNSKKPAQRSKIKIHPFPFWLASPADDNGHRPANRFPLTRGAVHLPQRGPRGSSLG